MGPREIIWLAGLGVMAACSAPPAPGSPQADALLRPQLNAGWVQSTPAAEKQKTFLDICARQYHLAPGSGEMRKCASHLDIRSRAMRTRTAGADWPRPDDVWFCPIPPGVKLFYKITKCQPPPDSIYGQDIWRIE